MTKMTLKKLVKNSVVEYWEAKLRIEASQLSSSKHFCASNLSLFTPHPLWSAASASAYEVSKATVQTRMLSGRY